MEQSLAVLEQAPFSHLARICRDARQFGPAVARLEAPEKNMEYIVAVCDVVDSLGEMGGCFNAKL